MKMGQIQNIFLETFDFDQIGQWIGVRIQGHPFHGFFVLMNPLYFLPWISIEIKDRCQKYIFKKLKYVSKELKNHKKLKFNLWKNQREKLVRENEIKTPPGQEIQQHYYLDAQNDWELVRIKFKCERECLNGGELGITVRSMHLLIVTIKIAPHVYLGVESWQLSCNPWMQDGCSRWSHFPMSLAVSPR